MHIDVALFTWNLWESCPNVREIDKERSENKLLEEIKNEVESEYLDAEVDTEYGYASETGQVFRIACYDSDLDNKNRYLTERHVSKICNNLLGKHDDWLVWK